MPVKKHNFSAGPSILPEYTFERCSQAVLELNEMGLSLLEISHRSDEFVDILNQTKELIKELLDVPSSHEILFIQGGASMQFCMIPYNLLPVNGKCGFVDTGTWSSKAIKEAKIFGETHVLASSDDKNYSYVPKEYNIPENLDFLHITTNNTIYGTQLKDLPKTDVTLIADMSSDIFSKPVDVSKYGLIYAGAQKNIGPSGITLVIIRKDLLGKTGRTIPSMLDYQNYIDKESMFNTPPTFAIYAMLQTLKWLKEEGGVPAMELRNETKADLLYSEIERNQMFDGVSEVEDRSLMNVTFRLKEEYKELETAFLKHCERRLISGIKGHRSVGGFRASIYNAMNIKSVMALVHCMEEFEKANN